MLRKASSLVPLRHATCVGLSALLNKKVEGLSRGHRPLIALMSQLRSHRYCQCMLLCIRILQYDGHMARTDQRVFHKCQSTPESACSSEFERIFCGAPDLVLARRQRRAEGLGNAVHVPLHPAIHGVLDAARVVLHPETLALPGDVGNTQVIVLSSHLAYGSLDLIVSCHGGGARLLRTSLVKSRPTAAEGARGTL